VVYYALNIAIVGIRVGGFGKVYKGELSHYIGISMVAFNRLVDLGKETLSFGGRS